MSSKHILGIGQLEPGLQPCAMCCNRGHYPIGETCPQCGGRGWLGGKVAIIHGGAVQCDHARPLATFEDCPQCLQEALDMAERLTKRLK